VTSLDTMTAVVQHPTGADVRITLAERPTTKVEQEAFKATWAAASANDRYGPGVSHDEDSFLFTLHFSSTSRGDHLRLTAVFLDVLESHGIMVERMDVEFPLPVIQLEPVEHDTPGPFRAWKETVLGRFYRETLA